MSKPLEYVASGIGLMRLNHSVFKAYEDLIEDVNNKTKKLNTDTHDWSILYNAYTEKDAGSFYRSRLDHANMYADSGGLQMVTKGLDPTEAQKIEIYDHQGKHSEFAMCFDKIPVQNVSEDDHISHAQARMMAYRIFDREAVRESARATGINLRKQIEHFEKIGSESTPVLILHGRDEDSYKLWIDEMMSQIPPDHWYKLKSVALAGSGLGVGDLEEVQKLYYATLLPKELNIKHVHLLGVGALRRMMPAVILQTNGFLKDCVVSYDSTKHAYSHILGNYFSNNGKLNRITREKSPMWEYIYEDVKNIMGLEDMTYEEFFTACNMSVLGYGEKFNKPRVPVMAHYSICFTAMYNFIRVLDEIHTGLSKGDFSVVMKYTKNTNLYASMMNLKSPDDYHHWFKHVSPFLKSKKLKVERDAHLGEFL